MTTGHSGVPPTEAEPMSAPANKSPKSEGLIGVASIRTRTWPAATVGGVTSAKESSNVPWSVTSERSSSE